MGFNLSPDIGFGTMGVAKSITMNSLNLTVFRTLLYKSKLRQTSLPNEGFDHSHLSLESSGRLERYMPCRNCACLAIYINTKSLWKWRYAILERKKSIQFALYSLYSPQNYLIHSWLGQNNISTPALCEANWSLREIYKASFVFV